MALSLRLGEHQAIPQRLEIFATVTLAEVDHRPTIVSSPLKVRGLVPHLDADTFQSVVDEAADLCPILRLFAGAQISVTAELEPA